MPAPTGAPLAVAVTVTAATPRGGATACHGRGAAERGDNCKRQLGRSFHRGPDRRTLPIHRSPETPMTPLVLANHPDTTCGAKHVLLKLLPRRCGSRRRQSKGRPSNRFSTAHARRASAQLSSGTPRSREAGNHLTVLAPTRFSHSSDRRAARRRVAPGTAANVVREHGNTGVDGQRQ